MTVVKEMFSRKRILPLLLIVILIIYWYFQKPTLLVHLEGQTFGTIGYSIKYKDDRQRDFKPSIDSLLIVFNNALSHYIPNSELSRFNASSQPQSYTSPFFLPVLEESKLIYDLTDGAYNPAIMPLVNAWGFGPEKSILLDSAIVDSLLSFTDYNLVEFNKQQVWKKDPRLQLDFSASAKGYGVDVIAHFLSAKGVENYFIEIGGEVICAGTNIEGKAWRIGIIDPGSDILNQQLIATVDLNNLALATSANNFNYRIIDNVKYSHTIDPKSGYPIAQSILSASVFARNCITADALATACMVMGVEKALALITDMEGVEALLIYSDENGQTAYHITDGIKPFVSFVDNN